MNPQEGGSYVLEKGKLKLVERTQPAEEKPNEVVEEVSVQTDKEELKDA